MKRPCPICESMSGYEEQDCGMRHRYKCSNCGDNVFTDDALYYTEQSLNKEDSEYHKLRWARFFAQRKPIPEEITQTYFDEHDGEAILPPAEKQITDFFLMFADASLFPGHNVRHGTSAITRRCWVPQASIEYMYRLHESAGRIDVIGASSDYVKLRLSSLGWEYYRDLTGGGSLSNRAFMAMKFDDQELNTALIEIFKPAAQAAGFELNPVNDNSEPGLIDLRIRNAIRRSRIVFADLTHSNQGVYWEAGFAEGYGIPVVYLCKEVKWNAEKTHFDVNHCTHILWDPKNPGKCKDEMTQLLRNLFPEDARLEDS